MVVFTPQCGIWQVHSYSVFKLSTVQTVEGNRVVFHFSFGWIKNVYKHLKNADGDHAWTHVCMHDGNDVLTSSPSQHCGGRPGRCLSSLDQLQIHQLLKEGGFATWWSVLMAGRSFPSNLGQRRKIGGEATRQQFLMFNSMRNHKLSLNRISLNICYACQLSIWSL